jgi:hypothetical protein
MFAVNTWNVELRRRCDVSIVNGRNNYDGVVVYAVNVVSATVTAFS